MHVKASSVLHGRAVRLILGFRINHWYFKTIRQLEEIKPVGGNTQIYHCIGYVKSCTAVRKSCKVEEIIWNMVMILSHMDVHHCLKLFWCQMFGWLDEAVCICRSIFVITVQSYFRDLTNLGSLVIHIEESNHVLWNINEWLYYVRSVNKCKNRTLKHLSLGTHQVVAVETSYFDIQQFSKNTSTVIVPWKIWLDLQNGLVWVCTTESTEEMYKTISTYMDYVLSSFLHQKHKRKKLSTETTSIDARATHQKFLLSAIFICI